MPVKISSYLQDEPTTPRGATAYPKWTLWRGALKCEMRGQSLRYVWKGIERPKGMTILGRGSNDSLQVPLCGPRFPEN